eukprot:scaffold5892_cov112-Isochrysis_galbana.AAC.19
MSIAVSVSTASRDFPPPDEARGCSERMVRNMEAVSFCAHVMSALSCSPKTSGPALTGRLVRYSMKPSASAASTDFVGHPASVVNVRRERRNDLVGHLLVVVDEQLRLAQRRVGVAVSELVLDVPAEGAELLSLEDDGVEEEQTEHHLAPYFGFVAGIEALARHGLDGRNHVGAQALRRLVGHLDAILQHRDRELGGGHRGEPQPERRVCLLRVDVLDLLLERREPRDEEVAIHQQHPPALLLARLDELLRLGPLPLTERDVV